MGAEITIICVIDPDISHTEFLCIHGKFPHPSDKLKLMLKINWCKFPNLRVLDIYDAYIDFSGIETCQKLESMYVPNFIVVPPELVTRIRENRRMCKSCYRYL